MSWLTLVPILEWTIRLGMVPVILRRMDPPMGERPSGGDSAAPEVPRPLPPATALAWLAVTFLVPEVGLVFYLLIGTNRLGRKRVRKHRAVIDTMRPSRVAAQQKHVVHPAVETASLPVVLEANRIGGMPILGGNQVELLTETQPMIDRLVADIDAARHHAHLLFYIVANDATATRVADALIRAAARGVECRVLADAAASRPFFRRGGLGPKLGTHKNIQVQAALPVNPLRRGLSRIDLRNHRKIVDIDGTVAFAGSQNIIDADYGGRRAGPWVDLMARFTGPVVAQLQSVFLEDWAFETGKELGGPDYLPKPKLSPEGDVAAQTVPTGPSHGTQALPRVLLTAIHAARRRVIITSPYLVPDESTMMALAMAVDRDVQVDLVVPRHSDHPLVSAAAKAHYDPLIDSGVNIYRYPQGLLHAKTMTVDDSFALLGSSNLDVRSFYLNFEVNVLLYGQRITNELRSAQQRYIEDSELLTKEQWRNERPRLYRYVDSAAALVSPLL